jgi:hypothetical protein
MRLHRSGPDPGPGAPAAGGPGAPSGTETAVHRHGRNHRPPHRRHTTAVSTPTGSRQGRRAPRIASSRPHTSTATAPSSSGVALREAITGGWLACAPPRLARNFLAGWPARRCVTRSGVMTVSPSIGNADCASVRDLMTPRASAMRAGVGLRPIRLRGSSRGGTGCPGPFTGPGHPGWGGRPSRGRMTCTVRSRSV